MAVNIPIWPGSSSFFAGDTPFGYYDLDTEFINDVDKVSSWCAKRLGYPIVDIELQDINFYTCFEESITEYSLVSLAKDYGSEAGSGGRVTYYTGSFTLSQGKQVYDLTDSSSVSLENGTAGVDDIEIKKVLHDAPPAMVRYFDPSSDMGMGSDQMLDSFGFGNQSPGVSFMMQPMYDDLLRVQAIEFNDMIRKSQYGFNIQNNRIRIFPIPLKSDNNTKVHFHYILNSDRTNSVVSIGTVSDCSIPIPNADITLDGSDLRSEAATEKEILISELRENLEATSRKALLEAQQQESEAMEQTLNRVPRAIYIGSYLLPLIGMFV